MPSNRIESQMPLYILILVALIQGLTEFLPVSSSGHLILLPQLTGLDDQGQAIDVAVHVGTLFAVMLYFKAEVAQVIRGCFDILARRSTQNAKLAFLLIIATIPVILLGLVLKLTGLSDAMRSIKVIAWTMLIFGLVLYWFDKNSPSERTMPDWSLKDAILMGLWQAIALIPGTSRSGATITGARALGFERSDAARIAMLMSIPTIIASGTLLGADVIASADRGLIRDAAIAAIFAFFAALGSLVFMMRLLRSVSFTPYVIYRVVLGVILLIIAYT
jgi:undecaprenyl-diphosphatase